MRIAYVTLHWPRTRNSGVGKKIESQIGAWVSAGHEACLFMHTIPHKPQADLIDGEYFFYTPANPAKTELNRILAMSRLIEAVKRFRPDIIYLRYSMYIFPGHRLMKIAPVVEEINTNDLSQHEQLGPIYNLYNRLTRGIFLSRVRGLVGVSRELAISPDFASFRKPTAVISNGIDLDSIQPLPAPHNKTPRLFFIATPGYSWHGVDKLVNLAQMVPDITVDIVGYDHIDEAPSLPRNIHLHGYLDPKGYIEVLSRADVAVSTLALHRKDMEDASPLKTRECLAYGLPLIIAYNDTDLDQVESDFLLKIPNKEDNIQTHAEFIRDFAYRMRGHRADRQLLEKYIDTKQKEARRLAFFEEIIQTSN